MKQVEPDVGSPPMETHAQPPSSRPTDNNVDVDVMDFESFYARELPRVVRLAAALTRNTGVAEELAHDAFFDAYRRWSHIGQFEDPGAWVRRAVVNRAASFHRRRLVEIRYRLRNDRAASTPPPELHDEELWREVGRLPTRQKQVIVLHYVDLLTTDQVATVLQISQASVKTHLQRARRTLNHRLTDTRHSGTRLTSGASNE